MILFLYIIPLLLFQPKETRCETDKLYGDSVCTTTRTGAEENCCLCYPGSSSCPSVCPSGLYLLATTYASCNFTNNDVNIEQTTAPASSSLPGQVTTPANETTWTTLIEAIHTDNSTDDNSTTTTPTTVSATTPLQHALIKSSICVKNCPDGFFGNDSSLCVDCDDVCATCNGPGSKNCQTCKFTNYRGECVRSLSQGGGTQDDDSLPAIVGGVVGGTVALIVVIVVVACVICKKRRGNEQPSLAMLDIHQIEDATEVNDQDSTQHVTDHSPIYGNMPDKPKDFSFHVLAKQDEIFRYTQDPTANLNNGEAKVEDNLYGNQMAIQLNREDRKTRTTLKRTDTIESDELTALGQPPPPPMEGQCDENPMHASVAVNEPEDVYQNTSDVQNNEDRTSTGRQLYQSPPNNAKIYGGQTNTEYVHENTNTETQLEPSEDYENFDINARADNPDGATEGAQNEFADDLSPSELYDNVRAGETNVGFVDDNDAPLYGNVEDLRNSTNDPIYGNIDSP